MERPGARAVAWSTCFWARARSPRARAGSGFCRGRRPAPDACGRRRAPRDLTLVGRRFLAGGQERSVCGPQGGRERGAGVYLRLLRCVLRLPGSRSAARCRRGAGDALGSSAWGTCRVPCTRTRRPPHPQFSAERASFQGVGGCFSFDATVVAARFVYQHSPAARRERERERALLPDLSPYRPCRGGRDDCNGRTIPSKPQARRTHKQMAMQCRKGRTQQQLALAASQAPRSPQGTPSMPRAAPPPPPPAPPPPPPQKAIPPPPYAATAAGDAWWW